MIMTTMMIMVMTYRVGLKKKRETYNFRQINNPTGLTQTYRITNYQNHKKAQSLQRTDSGTTIGFCRK